MGYEIKLGEFSITEHASFNLAYEIEQAENGKIRERRYSFEIEGDVVDTTAGAVVDKLILHANEITENLIPRRFQIILDGVTKFDFKPEECVNSPLVTSFETIPDDGNAGKHWKYRMRVMVRKLGSESESAYRVRTSITTIKKQNRVVRKIWTAEAWARSVTDALSTVLAFKPSESKLTETVKKDFQDAHAFAEWIWDARRAGDIISIAERVMITDSGSGWVEDEQVGDDPKKPPEPVFQRKLKKAAKLTIHVTIQAYSAEIKRLPNHYEETETIVHQDELELNSFPALTDDIEGIWTLEYTEVWWSSEGFGAPKHKDHAEITWLAAPSDGKMTQGA